MTGEAARWLDLGTLDPCSLHATVQGVAEAQTDDSVPVLVWARAAAPHVCLGASQGAEAELDVDACQRSRLQIVRRALGGGTVWVDGDQQGFFFILPRVCSSSDRARFFAQALAPALATYRDYGLDVAAVGRGDLWLGARKILGSGAATINRADVLGSSFLLRFPVARFAATLRCPSTGYRQWLEEELRGAMTAWTEHAPAPSPEELAQCFRHHVEATYGWTLRDDGVTDRERELSAAATSEVADVFDGPQRGLIPDGVKLNHDTYLLESRTDVGWARVVLRAGRIHRIALPDHEMAAALRGQVPAAAVLEPIIGRYVPPPEAARWAQFIDRIAQPARSLGDE